MNINIDANKGTVAVGKLVYGTLLTGVSSHPGSVYIKVDKRKPGEGISLAIHSSGYSMLLNLKTGALRIIPGDTRVTVLDGSLEAYMPSNLLPYVKTKYQDCV
jgi:hypothetical protein